MPENRNLRADLAALALLLANVLLALSLATYDPADPLGEGPLAMVGLGQEALVHPPNEKVANLAGHSGAALAHLLLSGFGVGTYLLLGTTVVLNARLLKRQPVTDPALRAVGWGMTLAALATLAAMVLPGVSQGPVVGPGGYLGAIASALLDSYFATAGGVLFAGSVLVAGLLLWTDYVVFRFLWRLCRLPFEALAGAGPSRRAVTSTEQQKKPRTRLRDDLSDEPMIRISGKTVEAPLAKPELAKPAAAELEDDEDEVLVAKSNSAAEDEDEEEEAAPDLRVNTPAAKKTDRQVVIEQLEAAVSNTNEEDTRYELPGIDLLKEGKVVSYEAHEKDVRQKAKILEETFASFGYNVKVVEIDTGPVIAQFEVELEAGLRLSKITGLADDLAIALRVPSVRIVAPIPGKNTVGIEVPNAERQLVRLREVMEEGAPLTKKMNIPIFLGKDVSGNPLVFDLTTMPHLLIAGRTGTGKSVCLNTLIVSMLMTRRPDEVKMLMIDPKMVELSGYKSLPHLMHPVVTDMKKAEAILAWAVDKMEERYALLARAGVRHVSVYNQLGEDELRRRLQPENEEQWGMIPKHLPFIVIVADEMADLMITCGKEVEQHIIRLAQKSRAVGIHLVLATQKPTVDVITGLIKSNLPARIAFQVASRTDSRVVLDEMGADKLLGNGDFLFLWPGTSTLLRGQGTYISDDEINSVIDCVGTSDPQYVQELVALKPKNEDGDEGSSIKKNRDELYEGAIDIVVREGRGSVSLLQRSLGIGYGRAARLIDFMAEDGIVGEYNGAQAREVLISLEKWAEMQGGTVDDSEPSGEPLAWPEVEAPKAGPRKARTVDPQPKTAKRRHPEPEEDEVDDSGAADHSVAAERAAIEEDLFAEEPGEAPWEEDGSEEDAEYDDGEFDEVEEPPPPPKPPKNRRAKRERA